MIQTRAFSESDINGHQVWTAARRVCVVLSAALLTACGGGNSGSTPAPPPPPPPPVPSSNANLAELRFTNVVIADEFDPSVLDYTATVGFLVASTEVVAVSEDTGASVAIDGTPQDGGVAVVHLAEGTSTIEISVTAEDGVTATAYRVEVTREPLNTLGQRAYLKASNAGEGDFFGESISLSGDTLAVGVRFEDGSGSGDGSDNSADNAGAVYIFIRDGSGGWTQQAYLKSSNSEAGDLFGRATSLLGNTLVVGAPGEAGNGLGGESDNSMFAAGAVYVFQRTGTTWDQVAYLKASNPDSLDQFGRSVALGEGLLAVGAIGEDSNGLGGQSDNNADGAGAVYVFARDGAGLWNQESYLKASNAEAGDLFGGSVTLDETALGVGALAEDGNRVNGEFDNSAESAGAAYVFRRNGTSWTQEAYIKASNAEMDDRFGESLSISGSTLVVGAVGEDSGPSGGETDNTFGLAGAAYVFEADPSGVWTQQAFLKAGNADPLDAFGTSVAISGTTVGIGARGESSNGVSEADNSLFAAGAAYVYQRDSTGVWSQRVYLKASNPDLEDSFGASIAISGESLAVGAIVESSNGIDGAADNSTAASGAVYVWD